MAYYPLSEGQGPIAHDQGPGGFDGTLATNGGNLPDGARLAQAIDLGDDGVTQNSTAPRQGPNNLQNFPLIATTADGQLEGWLGGSTADTTFRIDVFASAGYGPGGAGEADDYLGSLEVTTNSQGQAIFDVPYTPPAGMPVVTATATDPEGNTSEASAARTANLEAPTQFLRLVPGQPLIFSAASGDGIALQDPDAGPLDPAWDLTLSVAAGTLSLSSLSGLVGSGNGTSTLEYQGSLSALNAALEGLSYTQAAGSHGIFTMSLNAVSVGAPTAAGAGEYHRRILVGHDHRRQRHRLAAAGDPRFQRHERRREHDRFRDPRPGRPDDCTPLALAHNHQPGPDRRVLPAGLRRNALDRDRRAEFRSAAMA